MTTKTVILSVLTMATLFTNCKKKDSTPTDNSSATATPSTTGWDKKTSPVTTKLNAAI